MSISESQNISIESAAAQVAELAHQGGEANEFYAQFLRIVPQPPGTLCSIAWLCEPEAFQRLAAWSKNATEINLPFDTEEHTAMLLEAREATESRYFDPPASMEYGVVVENVLPKTLIVPVVVDSASRVLIEIFLPPGLPEPSYQKYRRGVQILCEIAGIFHRGGQSSGGHGALPADVFKSLRVIDTCYAIANEARRSLGCDRVSVLTSKADKFIVKAVSGQEAVNRKANVIQFLERLTACVLKTGQAFWYPKEAEDLAPEIERDLEHYIESAMCRRLGILPLRVDEQEHELGADATRPEEGEIYGALVVEDFTDAVDRGEPFKVSTTETAREAAIGLRNAVDHERIFLLPVWQYVGDQYRYFFGTKRKLSISVLTVLAILGLLSALIKVPFKVSCNGYLQPAIRRNVFAAISGTVQSLNVKHGSKVKEGDTLAVLRNTEVDLEMEQLRGQIRKAQTRLAALKTSQMSSLDPDDDGQMSAAAEAAEIEKQLVSFADLLTIQERQKAQLVITSPIDGEIITWNLEDRLKDRPVSMGQSLMTVAQLDGEWRLDLHLPDRRVAHLLRAQKKSDEPLDVTFIMASDPGTTHEGRVREVANATRVDASQGQNLLVRVDIVDENLVCRRSGTEVQAKIYCGKRSIGYVWLHDIFEFVQSRILFRFS